MAILGATVSMFEAGGVLLPPAVDPELPQAASRQDVRIKIQENFFMSLWSDKRNGKKLVGMCQ